MAESGANTSTGTVSSKTEAIKNKIKNMPKKKKQFLVIGIVVFLALLIMVIVFVLWARGKGQGGGAEEMAAGPEIGTGASTLVKRSAAAPIGGRRKRPRQGKRRTILASGLHEPNSLLGVADIRLANIGTGLVAKQEQPPAQPAAS